MQLAPIVIFLYNRPEHSKQTLINLSENDLANGTDVFIFIDGPKNPADGPLQDKLVQIISTFETSFKSIQISHSKINKGLASSVIDGVTKIVNERGRVIVLEDDIVTSKVFLTYMNKCLDLYQNEPNVYSINGYMFPIPTVDNYIFLSPLATSSWGWATWSDRWKCFSTDLSFKEVIRNNEFLSKRFNIGDLNYVDYMDNKNSWAIKWYYSVFIRNGLGVFPSKSLVFNTGFDGTGTNCGTSSRFQASLLDELPKLEILDTIDLKTEALLQNYFKSSSQKRGFRVVASKIKSTFKKLLK